MATITVEIDGHIIDSLLLPKVLDLIVASGADYELRDVHIGKTSTDPSHAVIDITMPDGVDSEALLIELQVHGANVIGELDASLVPAPTDGVLPEGFYATTNLPTVVRVGGDWLEVARPEMDCAIVVDADRGAQTAPMHKVRHGDPVVVGLDGVRVTSPTRRQGSSLFEFMASDVSSEKPQALLVHRVAERMRLAHAEGGSILVVCGPAVVHTGAASELAALVRAGWVDVLFAGNGFATHDIESSVLGTSLGISVDGGEPAEGGHGNHLRVINDVRRHGSIAKAVEAGFVTSGVMYECVVRGVPFVLGGSVRDDGPLPDVITDVVAAADRMRAELTGVSVALMFASTLHAIATGNLLPASVETFCVDINQAVVTKLADRGSHQVMGIVTDVGLFTRNLARELLG
ncbi:MAG: TIGR00300 family protein [Actinobacteria bacterium]|nr:TIGR00300 family protein [Actinomycetota bacterium]